MQKKTCHICKKEFLDSGIIEDNYDFCDHICLREYKMQKKIAAKEIQEKNRVFSKKLFIFFSLFVLAVSIIASNGA